MYLCNAVATLTPQFPMTSLMLSNVGDWLVLGWVTARGQKERNDFSFPSFPFTLVGLL